MTGDEGLNPSEGVIEFLRRISLHGLDGGAASHTGDVDEFCVRVTVRIVVVGTQSKDDARRADGPFTACIEDAIEYLGLVDCSKWHAVLDTSKSRLVSA